MSKDYYKILGIEKNASHDDIKKAYKNLAKKFHPDLNKDAGATEKFKEINEAAAILGDEQKRQHYDQYGTAEAQDMNGFDFRDFGGFDIDSLFENFFGGGGMFGGGRRRANKGHDLAVEVEISLEEAAAGVKKTITINTLVPCEECDGKGGKGLETCSDCGGKGMVRSTKRTPFGIFSTTGPCATCRGSGQTFDSICDECEGQGRVSDRKSIEVKIPAGVHHGMRLRLQGQGEAGEHGSGSGDLFVIVHVRESAKFKREGDDLFMSQPINFKTACLGGTVDVMTLDTTSELKIPAGTDDLTEFRLKGKGMPSLEGGHGDLYVKVFIEVPKKLSKQQKEMLEGLE